MLARLEDCVFGVDLILNLPRQPPSFCMVGKDELDFGELFAFGEALCHYSYCASERDIRICCKTVAASSISLKV